MLVSISDERRYKVYAEGSIEPKNRFKQQSRRIKTNFNSDLIRVAADKVQNIEIASMDSSDTQLSNGKRVERLLRSVEKKRSSTDMMGVPAKESNKVLRASLEETTSKAVLINQTNI